MIIDKNDSRVERGYRMSQEFFGDNYLRYANLLIRSLDELDCRGN